MTTDSRFLSLPHSFAARDDLPGESHSSLEDDYREIRHGAAALALSWLDAISMTGSERTEWLQGMVTADLSGMKPGDWRHACALDVKGKTLAQLLVGERGDSFLLVGDRVRLHALRGHFDRYIIADDVEVHNTDNLPLTGLMGPGAEALLADTRVPLPLLPQPAWLVLDGAPEGASPVSFDAVNVARIEDGIPWDGIEVLGDRMPLETGLAGTISTEKGCYLGQETIIRVLHRGHVNRGLVGLVCEGSALPQPGADLTDDQGKSVGTVTSSAHSIKLGTPAALAIVRTTAGEPGTVLWAGDLSAEVRRLTY